MLSDSGCFAKYWNGAGCKPPMAREGTLLMNEESQANLTMRLERWREHPAWQRQNLLDIRSARDFRERHLVGSVSIPVPVPRGEMPSAELLEQDLPSIFLPPRHEPLAVVASETQLAEAVCAHLATRGRDEPLPVAITGRQWDWLPADVVVSGRSRHHLWQPPPFLEQNAHLLPPPNAGPVLDLACGSGRAAVWLAARGYRVTGIDWQPEALQAARRLADSCGIICDFQGADLRDAGAIPAGRWAVVLNFRFLQRDLLERMASLLMPGGIAVIRTFRYVPGHQQQPRRKYCLEPGELLRYFPADANRVLIHEENFDPDGRPAAGIVAGPSLE